MDKPYVSATQIDMLCRCGEQYRRRYVEKEVIPPGIAMLKGSGFHRGAEINMRQKIDSHEDMPVKEIVDAAVEEFRLQTQGGYQLSDEEVARGPTSVIGEAIDELATMAEVHAEQQAPDYQPVLVEQAVRIPLPGTHDLLGVIDLADDKSRIVDFKTSKKKKSAGDAHESVQLTIYAASWQSLHQAPPALVRLDTVVSTKTRCERQVLDSTRCDKDFSALASRINMVTSAISSGVFLPASPGSWWCGPKWCGFWASCPYINSERRDAAERNGD
jgi:hypothetical protein